ncbi:S-layer homology domain-containing protein [Bacillus sp. HMF5848]|uniref:S-layer homology domain-containing protein n=1 Tax=Bacillus sp. HMF5848 TaxID=2495421 RepID=UPI000F78F82F|nr:S-layer homology domain-containing protein [Bacillus sp. HMF5848]RSK28700.1 S-layer homology domain-containing protein [Bacillus sp. HMF5848]
MKKYPLSSKAMKAMLATSLAFTPVFATGVALHPSVVVAAENEYSTIEELVEYLDSVYDVLSEDEKVILTDARDRVAAITEEEWNEYAARAIKDGTANQVEKEGLFADLLQLLTSANVLNLNDNIDSFRESQADNVDAVFGPEVTVDKLLNYIASVQSNFLDSISNLDVDTAAETEIYWELYNAIKDTEDEHGISDKFVAMLDQFETLLVMVELSDTYDTEDREVRNTLIKALQEVQGEEEAPVVDPDPTPSPSPSPSPSPAPAPAPTPAPDRVDVPVDAIEKITQPNAQGKIVAVSKIKAEKVADLVKNIDATKSTVALKVEAKAGEVAKAVLPVNLFTEASKKNKNAKVAVESNGASYTLPVKEIKEKLTELAQSLGVAETDIEINISVSVVEATDTAVTEATKKNKTAAIVSDVIEFSVEVSSGDKTKHIDRFSTYVERKIAGKKDFNSNNSVAVRIEDDGDLVAIPTLFNGKEATIKSLTNSKYTVIENNKTFPDVDNNMSWAESFIEPLASKLIIQGKDNGTYAPEELMTRAQFTVLLVRALGLPSEEYTAGTFTDVKGDEWFNENGELAAAVKTGIIQGKDDGSFDAYGKITRAQAAIMMQRAMALAFLNYDTSKLDVSKDSADFTDAAAFSTWEEAADAIEAIYQAGIVGGKDDGSFDAYGYTTRAQMAKILANFLVSAELMNSIK